MFENILDLNWNESEKGRKFNMLTGSQKFIQKFNNGQEEIDIENILNKFYYAKKSDLENINSRKTTDNNFDENNYNLLCDLHEYIDETKSLNLASYKSNFYGLEFKNKKDEIEMEYFSVKYTVFKSNLDKNIHNHFVIVIIRSIDYETYHLKNQQINVFGNILLSSLTHELKTPINSLFGQLYIFEKDSTFINKIVPVLQKFINQDKVKFSKELEIYFILSDYFDKNEKITTIFEKLSLKTPLPLDKIILLSCCFFVNFFKSFIFNLKIVYYLLKKINLIITNFEIFSRNKLKLSFNIKFGIVNLHSILTKSFKILYKMSELNYNNLDVEIETAKFCMIITDSKLFKILIRNSILLIEKISKYSDLKITINIGLTKNEINNLEENSQLNSTKKKLEIILELKNKLSYQNNHNEQNEKSIDVMDIFRKNNKVISKLIECETKEFTSENERSMKYIISITNYTISDLISEKENKSSKTDKSLEEINIPDLLLQEENDNTNHYPRRKANLNFSSFESKLENRNKCKITELFEEDFTNELNEEKNTIEIHPSEHLPNDLNIISSQLKSQNENIYSDVMIVDDDSLCINYLQNVIKQKNKNLVIATNGKEAHEKMRAILNSLKELKEKKFLIFMDIYMPVMNGIESAKLIEGDVNNFNNTHEGSKINCQIYFVTGNTESQISDLTKENTLCKGIFTKPIKKKDILNLINN